MGVRRPLLFVLRNAKRAARAVWLRGCILSAHPHTASLQVMGVAVMRHSRSMANNRSASDTVRAYFAGIRSRDSGVADLFDEAAQLVGLGQLTSGREEIRSFYAKSIANASPTPDLIGDLLVSGDRVAAEIRIALADGSNLHVVDLFVVRSGLIQSLTYFLADES